MASHTQPVPDNWRNEPLPNDPNPDDAGWYQFCPDCMGDGRKLTEDEFALGLQVAKNATQGAALSFVDNPEGTFSLAYHAMIRVLREYGVKDPVRE